MTEPAMVVDGVMVKVDVHHDPETGTYTNRGSHGVVVIHSGGLVHRLQPGESLTPAKEGTAAVHLRNRDA
jgi:hypothetical protein